MFESPFEKVNAFYFSTEYKLNPHNCSNNIDEEDALLRSLSFSRILSIIFSFSHSFTESASGKREGGLRQHERLDAARAR